MPTCPIWNRRDAPPAQCPGGHHPALLLERQAEDAQGGRFMSEQVRECVDYFRSNPGYHRILAALRQKYQRYNWRQT